jgi:hypothetical protein
MNFNFIFSGFSLEIFYLAADFGGAALDRFAAEGWPHETCARW